MVVRVPKSPWLFQYEVMVIHDIIYLDDEDDEDDEDDDDDDDDYDDDYDGV